ncbi:hypothetical protein PR202_gb15405 [Eleusine coracana subsp. coracana]|uniref:PDZ domain-containing protein n=1 Tax=Eleusine coracana subsp. coracana TaxID=191504 RepID=A0AAV5EYT2_ELECO|nr:hypothetical protein PR202_gb15405 [Eleusine coracana subsp. coracana]
MHCLASAAPTAVAAASAAAWRVGRRRLVVECAVSGTNDGEPAPQRSMRAAYDLGEMSSKTLLLASKRKLITLCAFSVCLHSSRYFSALALGDPSVKIEDVTPKIFPSGPLFPTENRIAELFETNTYSVVNIFDSTLRPQLNVTGVVEIPEGNGSGVVWDDSGHIVTNYHVVGSALSKNPKPGDIVARVTILAAEGIQKSFEGKLVGADRAKDLAVLKVEAPKDLLKPINVGQSSTLRVGQQCLAIGNPFGFDHTLTVGVISGLNRDIFSQAGVTIGGGIQTDAAINPGMSAGVGFAIPSSTVLKITPQLIQFGKVRRAGLNVEFAPDLIAYQLNVRNGALILKVTGGSAAAQAGLTPTGRGFAGNIILGDIIVAVDGKPVKKKRPYPVLRAPALCGVWGRVSAAGLTPACAMRGDRGSNPGPVGYRRLLRSCYSYKTLPTFLATCLLEQIKGKSDLLRVLDDYNVGDQVTLTVQRGAETLEVALPLEEESV